MGFTLVSAQKIVTKTIKVDEGQDCNIRIEADNLDSNIVIIIDRDGQVEKFSLDPGSKISQRLQQLLAEHDIDLDNFNFEELEDI